MASGRQPTDPLRALLLDGRWATAAGAAEGALRADIEDALGSALDEQPARRGGRSLVRAVYPGPAGQTTVF